MLKLREDLVDCVFACRQASVPRQAGDNQLLSRHLSPGVLSVAAASPTGEAKREGQAGTTDSLGFQFWKLLAPVTCAAFYQLEASYCVQLTPKGREVRSACAKEGNMGGKRPQRLQTPRGRECNAGGGVEMQAIFHCSI